ncbi:hypothetical protein Tco_0059311 [Tanacetum coccineum]
MQDTRSGFLGRKRPVILDFERSVVVETSISPLLPDSHTFEKDINFQADDTVYCHNDTSEYLLRRSTNVATDDTSSIHNLSWEQQLGSTSKYAERVHTLIVLDFQNSAIV